MADHDPNAQAPSDPRGPRPETRTQLPPDRNAPPGAPVPVEATLLRSAEFALLAGALAKAQLRIGSAEKNAENPHFKKPYADLASIREAFRVPLAENEIAFTQVVWTNPRGEMVVTTMLLHTSGQFIEGAIRFKPEDNNPQGTGSKLTYMKRYAAAAITGVAASDDDDDGEGAQGRGPNGPPPRNPPPARGRDDGPRGGRDEGRPPPQDRGGDRSTQGQPPARQGAPMGQTSAPAQPAQSAAAPTTDKAAAPPYPGDLTGEAKAHYDAIVAKAKEAKTKLELGALAPEIAGLPYPEGSTAHAYIHWVFDYMGNRLSKPATKR